MMEGLDFPDGVNAPLLVRLLIALGIGLLIGIEREYAKRMVEKEEQFAGVRTYPLIALFGFLCAYLGERYGEWLIIAGLAGFMAMVIASYVLMAKPDSYGITTELAGVIAFLLGAAVHEGHILLATLVTVIVTTLLSLKVKLHRFISMLDTSDIRAFIQFTVISALVLPFLPNTGFGPGEIWNLRDIWTMVILVTGISLAGYLLAKVMGPHRGTLLAGLIGGLVSSTAVALSLSRRSRDHAGAVRAFAPVGIVAATAVLYPRILLETWVVDRSLGRQLLVPVLVITAVAIGAAWLLHRKEGKDVDGDVPVGNPLNFAVAIQFVLAYMAVQWIMALAADRWSEQGLYTASLLFGTTDMDAITLSIAHKRLPPESLQGMTAVLLATISNTFLKYALVLLFGDRSLRWSVGFAFGAIGIATIAVLAFARL